MSSLSFALLAAVLAGVPDLPPPPTPAGESKVRPAPERGSGGPYEPAEETIVVEGEPAAARRPFTIAPDPALARRYAPREREPLNRVTIPF
jgi:hypothetical protein